jgi:hypothetical protein
MICRQMREDGEIGIVCAKFCNFEKFEREAACRPPAPHGDLPPARREFYRGANIGREKVCKR